MAKRGSKTRERPRAGSCLGQALLIVLLLVAVYLVLQLQSCAQALNGVRPAEFLNSLFGGGQTRIGLVAGHAGNDPGAVCADGLQEVTINQDIAERTAGLLRRAGYRVDLLQEFDPQLKGYTATAFLSIHTDSCTADMSGFKVARLPASQVPEAADRLVAALYRDYAAATGLEPHVNTITYDMREYHAFREIAPETPAAIIEIGFMGRDRDLLTRQPDRAARGIARGIISFVRDEEERAKSR